MEDYESKIKERELDAFHVVTASLLSGFSEIGVLNQAVANQVMGGLARRLAAWFKAYGIDPGIAGNDSLREKVEKVWATLNKTLQLAAEVAIADDGEATIFEVTGGKCRICPVGVGEAEIKGTACPYPFLIKGLLDIYSPDGKVVELLPQGYSVLRKDSGHCFIKFVEK